MAHIITEFFDFLKKTMKETIREEAGKYLPNHIWIKNTPGENKYRVYTDVVEPFDMQFIFPDDIVVLFDITVNKASVVITYASDLKPIYQMTERKAVLVSKIFDTTEEAIDFWFTKE